MAYKSVQKMELRDKYVLVRLDLNLPIKNGKIQDESRLIACLPTLQHILKQTPHVAIMSHLGRPADKPDPEYSLELVGCRLAELLGCEVVFTAEYGSEPIDQLMRSLGKNQIALLENLRFHPEEKANDPEFCKNLVKGFDFYINDAFGTLHREHASIVGIPQILNPSQRGIGLLVEKETEGLTRLERDIVYPYAIVMGGKNVSDKIGAILNLMMRCNHLIIGGAMAYTFLRFLGHETANSAVEEDKLDLVDSILQKAEDHRVKIHLPVDHICAHEFDQNAQAVVVDGKDIPSGMMGLDIGPKTAQNYSEVIAGCRTILWNGPMGLFEWPNFAKGTEEIAKAIANVDGYNVAGGGDTLAALNQVGLSDKFSHISTGGGASLKFLEGGELPGLAILKDQ